MTIVLFSRKRLLARHPTWYFRIVAKNGEPVAQSEGYSRRIDAKETALVLKRDLASAEIRDA